MTNVNTILQVPYLPYKQFYIPLIKRLTWVQVHSPQSRPQHCDRLTCESTVRTGVSQATAEGGTRSDVNVCIRLLEHLQSRSINDDGMHRQAAAASVYKHWASMASYSNASTTIT